MYWVIGLISLAAWFNHIFYYFANAAWGFLIAGASRCAFLPHWHHSRNIALVSVMAQPGVIKRV